MDRDELVQEDPRQEILDIINERLSTNRSRLEEIKAQVEQMQLSVDKEQQRYSGIAMELRNIQDNLTTVPREDIRDKYDEALNVRFRLATMRGQLEKFEAQYEYMEQLQTLLSQIISKLQGYEPLDDGLDMAEGQTRGALNIIRIIQAQEEERQRLARQMHDGPAQSLTNFILQTEICQRLFDRDQERAKEELNNLKTNSSKTFQKIRDFIFDLRPMMLDDLGVVPTVRRYVESYREKNDINTELEIIGEEHRMENHREVMIFRSIQELMVLARDYANCGHVKVRLDVSQPTVKIMVEDDGRGFDAEEVNQPDEAHNDARVQGLIMLKEKFELVGGTISVDSGEDTGTVIQMELPE